MKRFNAHKQVTAQPMTRLAYNELREWTLPANENGADDGYLTVDINAESNFEGYDGHVSWTPKAMFEDQFYEVEKNPVGDCVEVVSYGKSAHPIKEGGEFDFGTALHFMELGERVQRAGWNGKGMFVYQVPAASYPAQRNAKGVLVGDYPEDMVPYAAYLALKTASGEVVPWTISQSDALATDWMLHADEISEPQYMTDEQVKKLVEDGIVIASDCFELDGNESFNIDMALSLIESDEIACQRADSGVVLTHDDVAADDWRIVDAPKPSHVTRLNIERNQIYDRLEKLSPLLKGGQPNFINSEQWALLHEQEKHMIAYRDVLNQRIKLSEQG